MKIFQSKLLKNIRILEHGFFSRQGGVSEGHFHALNFALSKGDSPENVKQNRSLAMQKFGYSAEDLCCLTQVHSNRVFVVTKKFGFLDPSQPSIEADALITLEKGIPIGILTADCVPVLLATKNGDSIAAAHAGWRGALNGILENTVEAMQAKGADQIVAVIGPCIHQQNYEVGHEVYDSVLNLNSENKKFFAPSLRTAHFMFDLPGFVEDKLSKMGIQEIENINQDTYTQEALFFSCRRATHKQEPNFGCQLSVIVKK